MGALANEGGLSSEDFGHIDIRMDHSLVELPGRLSDDAWNALKATRISGKLIELTPDRGPRAGDRNERPSGRRPERRGDSKSRSKPRWKD